MVKYKGPHDAAPVLMRKREDHISVLIGFFKRARRSMAMTEPISRERRYMGQFCTTANTKIPPCGAGSVQPNSMESAPATAEPTTQEGITRRGSDAAKGMTPSVMKEKPMI